MMRKLESSNTFSRRLRLSSHGILLAMVLTIAAVVFLASALRSQAPVFNGESRDAAADRGRP